MLNPYVLAAAALFVIAVAAGAGVKGYLVGRESRESEVVELRTAIETSKAAAAEAEARNKAASAKAKASYDAKVKQIRLEAENRPQLIRVIRDESTCTLPAAWGVLHNSAAGGAEAPSPTEPIDPAAAAEVVASNYEACRAEYEKLKALQDIIKESGGNNNKQD